MEERPLVFSFWIAAVERKWPNFPTEKQARMALLQALILHGLLKENASAQEFVDGLDRDWGINERWA